MLFSYADIKETIRMRSSKELQAGSVFHGSRYSADLLVAFSDDGQRFSEYG